MNDGLVIVGASLAGAKAAEGARLAGWDRPIRLVGAEPHLPYERPLLAKGTLIGIAPPLSTLVHDGGFYAANEIDLVLGVAATSLDLNDHSIELHGGRRLHFDKLVLATGSTARTLTIAGGALPGVFSLRTIDDCLALRDALLPHRKVVVIGGNWIGTETAACARQRGCDVTLIERSHAPLSGPLGPEVAAWYAELHRSHGVDLRTNASVTGVLGRDRVTGVRLDDGTVIDADVVIAGIGVTPNVDLARAAGLATDTGVRCDEYLRASHPDVLVAGDIAEAFHPVLGRRVRVEHWANALNQGLTAGANAAGRHDAYARVPYFYSDQYDSGMEYSGWQTPWNNTVIRGSPDDGHFMAFYRHDDTIVGATSVNVWDTTPHVQRLVTQRVHVPAEILADSSISPADWPATADVDANGVAP